MAVLGVQMMMLKDKVSTLGMYPVLQRIADLGITAVEVSQIPMDEENTAALRRGIDRLGLDVGALSVMLEPGSATPGDNLRDHFDKIVADCHRLETRFVRIGMVPMAAMATKRLSPMATSNSTKVKPRSEALADSSFSHFMRCSPE